MTERTIRPAAEQKLNDPKQNLKLTAAVGHRDHYMYDLFYNGKKITVFQISRSPQEFGKPLIGKMARQLGISSHQLQEIEKCTFFAQDFIRESRLIASATAARGGRA